MNSFIEARDDAIEREGELDRIRDELEHYESVTYAEIARREFYERVAAEEADHV